MFGFQEKKITPKSAPNARVLIGIGIDGDGLYIFFRVRKWLNQNRNVYSGDRSGDFISGNFTDPT